MSKPFNADSDCHKPRCTSCRYCVDQCKRPTHQVCARKDPHFAHPRAEKANKKQVAFLYQQSESIAMDAVRDELKTLQISVLANVHDAIYLDQRLEPSQKDRIERTMRSNTGLDYWTLDEDIIKGYRDFEASMSTIPDVCTKVKLVSRPISAKHASTRSAATGTWVRTTLRNAIISSATREKGRTRRPLFSTSDRSTTRS